MIVLPLLALVISAISGSRVAAALAGLPAVSIWVRTSRLTRTDPALPAFAPQAPARQASDPTSRLSPGPDAVRRTSLALVRLWLICIGLGLGLLISSASMLASLALAGGTFASLLLTDLLLVAVVTGGLRRSVRRPRARLPASLTGRRSHVLFSAPALTAVTLACATAVAIVNTAPHGWFDAWYIWNLRARFFYFASTDWTRAFADTAAIIHRDYPLLLPLNVARLWLYLGDASTLVPRTFALLMTLMTLGLLYASLAILRGHSHACLAVIILVSVDSFIYTGASQTADVPLSFFILAALSTLAFAGSYANHDKGVLMLVGALAGAAAWTKNEGLLFAVLLTIATAAARVGPGRPPAWRVAVHVSTGFIPVLLGLLAFKLVSPRTSILAPQATDVLLMKLSDPQRHMTILRSLGESMNVDGWLMALLACLALSRGVRPHREHRPVIAIGVVVLLALLCGYYLVYLFTPHDLSMHIATSVGRLWMHLWPGVLFLLFLALGDIDGVQGVSGAGWPGQAGDQAEAG